MAAAFAGPGDYETEQGCGAGTECEDDGALAGAGNIFLHTGGAVAWLV
jgi:hypothetical protein